MGKARADIQSKMPPGSSVKAPDLIPTRSIPSLPLINNHPNYKIEAAKRKKAELVKSLEFSKYLSDGGEKIRYKLAEIEKEY